MRRIHMETRMDKRQHKKKRKWPYWIAGCLAVLILLIGGYVYYMWDKISDTMETMHNPLARDDDPERQKELEARFQANQSINILLLGVDERAGDKGRSDTMILMSLNPKTDSMIMMSIPRDTYVNIPGHGMDKINHAYAFGDVPLSIQTVEEAFDLPIHFYAKINMQGFEQGIDALGGVTVQNDMAFSQNGEHFPEGPIHLNGKQALEFIRMRKKDPRGDMGRNERQRDVIKAAIDVAASFSSMTQIKEILGLIGSNVVTDMDPDRLQSLVSSYRGTRKNVKAIEIKGDGQYIGSIWYYVVADDEFNRIHNDISEHMEAD